MSTMIEEKHYRFLVDFFHSLPHLNMYFHKSLSDFDPTSSEYLETILFWLIVPILFLILILLVLILYACCLVCKINSNTIKLYQNANGSNSSTSSSGKQPKLTCFKVFISIFVIFLSISLGTLVYGSENFHHSFNNVTMHIRGFSNYFSITANKTQTAKVHLLYTLTQTIPKFEKDIRNSQGNQKFTNDALRELLSIRHTLNESLVSLQTLNQLENERNTYLQLTEQIDVIEKTRWAVMIGFVTVNMLLIVFLVSGLVRNSKGSLCFFAFAGVLSLIFTWALNAIYLGITVFFADFCVLPDEYVLYAADKNHMKNMVQYYTTCTSNSNSGMRSSFNKYQPFKLDLNKAESKLRTAATIYNDNLLRMSQNLLGEQLLKTYNFPETIASIENILDNIRSNLGCEQTSASYKLAVKSLCSFSIFNLSIVVASSIIFGLIIPILICIIPQMWRRMHTKDYYEYHGGINGHGTGLGLNVDESHPFISHTNGSTGGGIRTNISAARQFNQSPNFQRLNPSSTNTTTSTVNNINNGGSEIGGGSRISNTNSLGRPRYSSNNNNNNNTSISNSTRNQHQGYSNATMYNQNKMNRINEYMLNSDPYSMCNPSAPAPIYQSYYTQIPTMSRDHHH